ncbi:NUDIX domain-containing protein [Streptacidiphilus sp. EB103A]|uniref:NUDIX domain-containing protein n=1 Tax=Streptacidiphilus sp. EB103A TaxID=3156275 RepID=UPI0035197225
MAPARSDIHDVVRAYLDGHPGEREALLPLLEVLDGAAAPTDRATAPGHITCSAVVVDDAQRVLHIRHRGTGGQLLAPGGHVEDSDPTLLAAALRELHEEAGIAPGMLCLTPQFLGAPIDINVHDIAAAPAKGEPAHQHYDLRFVFYLTGGRPQLALQEEEVSGAVWLPFDQVSSPTLRAKLQLCALDGRPEPVNASALIYDDQGRYLLHLRDNYPGIWAPGEFSLLGGGREPDDHTLEETLLRELAEEVPGLALMDLEPFAVEQVVGTEGLCVPIQTFAGCWIGDPRTLTLNEGVLLHWVRPHELNRLRIQESTRDLIHRHASLKASTVPRARPAEAASSGDGDPVLNGIGAHLYLEDDQGRVLLGLRHPDSAYAANTWHFLAGRCEQESVRDCVVREALEEAGLVINPDELEFVHTVHLIDYPGARPLMQMVFRARRWTGSPQLTEPDKCLAWQWWHPDALPDPIVAYTRAAIDGIREGRLYTQLGWEEPADSAPAAGERLRCSPGNSC